jgi:hypothetical protein
MSTADFGSIHGVFRSGADTTTRAARPVRNRQRNCIDTLREIGSDLLAWAAGPSIIDSRGHATSLHVYGTHGWQQVTLASRASGQANFSTTLRIDKVPYYMSSLHCTDPPDIELYDCTMLGSKIIVEHIYEKRYQPHADHCQT